MGSVRGALIPSSKKVARKMLAWRALAGNASMALGLDEVFAGID